MRPRLQTQMLDVLGLREFADTVTEALLVIVKEPHRTEEILKTGGNSLFSKQDSGSSGLISLISS